MHLPTAVLATAVALALAVAVAMASGHISRKPSGQVVSALIAIASASCGPAIMANCRHHCAPRMGGPRLAWAGLDWAGLDLHTRTRRRRNRSRLVAVAYAAYNDHIYHLPMAQLLPKYVCVSCLCVCICVSG